MTWQGRIVMDPAILTGKPVIKGTRIAVEFFLELTAQGWTHRQIEQNDPSVTDEGLQAARNSVEIGIDTNLPPKVEFEKFDVTDKSPEW